MLTTMNGVAVLQMDVNPTMSLNNMVTSSCVLASIVSPGKRYEIKTNKSDNGSKGARVTWPHERRPCDNNLFVLVSVS